MALYRCASGGGGAPQETTLWTNSAPTSAQSELSITLSDSMGNYDYIKIEWRASTSKDSRCNVLVSKDIMQSNDTMQQSTSQIGITYSSYIRKVDTLNYMDNGTLIHFGTDKKVGTSGTGSGYFVIPTKISGIKL